MRYILLTTFIVGLGLIFHFSKDKKAIALTYADMTDIPVYIASKKGSVFGYPWCGNLPRIKSENILIFSHKNDALDRGFRPMKGCSSMD